MAPRRALPPSLALAFLLCVAAVIPAAAQTATASSLRSAFLFNFAKFTQWPAEALPPAAPLVICVLGDPAVAAELEQSARNQILEGHRIVVWKGLGEGSVQSCHMLYVAAAVERQVQASLDTVRNAPVLTVGESSLFAETGGSVQLFRENDRMRFAVNIDAVQRQKLHLSAQLLSLAKVIRSSKDAPRN
jgi:hypothetical protein